MSMRCPLRKRRRPIRMASDVVGRDVAVMCWTAELRAGCVVCNTRLDLLHRAGSVPPMRRSDIHAVGDIAAEALAAGGTLAKEMHQGIASRPFGLLGPAAAPAR